MSCLLLSREPHSTGVTRRLSAHRKRPKARSPPPSDSRALSFTSAGAEKAEAAPFRGSAHVPTPCRGQLPCQAYAAVPVPLCCRGRPPPVVSEGPSPRGPTWPARRRPPVLREGAQGAWRPRGTGLPVAFTPFVFTCEAETRTPAGLWLRRTEEASGGHGEDERGRDRLTAAATSADWWPDSGETVVTGSWARGLRRLSALSSRDSRELKLF